MSNRRKTLRLEDDEQRRLIAEQERINNLNKFRLKGSRNKNNPLPIIKKASEVKIVKQANYLDCASCHLCISDNIYKVYDLTDDQGQELEQFGGGDEPQN